MPARRAVSRWAWRLFRREWRQQLLVLALLVLAVAATTFSMGLAANAGTSSASVFGTADLRLIFRADDRQLVATLSAARAAFGQIEVIAHDKVSVPGSAAAMDLRDQDPHGVFGHSTLALRQGRWPIGADDVAVTTRAASIFDLHVGDGWRVGGRVRQVVGVVENPLNLKDTFVLVAPGQATHAGSVSVLVRASNSAFERFHAGGGGLLDVEVRPTGEARTAAIIVLLMSTVGLLFVGLVAVAGFTVMAHRRMRALGMLGAVGATDRHVRFAMLSNGAAVGTMAAVLGSALGLVAWIGFAPRLEQLTEHRIDRFNLPWWAIGSAMLLAIGTSVVAAWWPARAASRIPVVAALSGRPAPPRPAHRFAALGVVLLVAGPVLLELSHQTRPPLIVAGVVATAVGVLLLAPLAIAGLAALGRRSPIAVRLSLRDLARYQSRSGAALAAISLALGISIAITVTAAANEAADAAQAAASGGNLPSNELLVWASTEAGSGLVPSHTAAELALVRSRVQTIAAQLHATSVLPLLGAVDPQVPLISDGPGGQAGIPVVVLGKAQHFTQGGHRVTAFKAVSTLYVATPEVLAHYGIGQSDVPVDADLLSSRPSFAGYELIPGRHEGWRPTLKQVHLPRYTSDPHTVLLPHAMKEFGFTTVPLSWLVDAPHALTPGQIDKARRLAAASGISIETRPDKSTGLTQLRRDATAAGVLLALAVLAMTVGLIRSETAGDLRTLTATGASSTTRRSLTGATAGSLALLGAVLGTLGAYVALMAWDHKDLSNLGHVPYPNLAVVVIGLPLAATLGGWLLAGREPHVIARQPIE